MWYIDLKHLITFFFLLLFSYHWAIASAPDLTIPDVMDWRVYNHWHRSDCVDVPLTHAHKYYNYVRAYNQALNSRSTNKTSDGGGCLGVWVMEVRFVSVIEEKQWERVFNVYKSVDVMCLQVNVIL